MTCTFAVHSCKGAKCLLVPMNLLTIFVFVTSWQVHSCTLVKTKGGLAWTATTPDTPGPVVKKVSPPSSEVGYAGYACTPSTPAIDNEEPDFEWDVQRQPTPEENVEDKEDGEEGLEENESHQDEDENDHDNSENSDDEDDDSPETQLVKSLGKQVDTALKSLALPDSDKQDALFERLSDLYTEAIRLAECVRKYKQHAHSMILLAHEAKHFGEEVQPGSSDSSTEQDQSDNSDEFVAKEALPCSHPACPDAGCIMPSPPVQV